MSVQMKTKQDASEFQGTFELVATAAGNGTRLQDPHRDVIDFSFTVSTGTVQVRPNDTMAGM